MTLQERNRAALNREREARQNAYLSAVAERDASPDARAEARVRSALHALDFWGDPIPGQAVQKPIPESTAPALPCSPSRPAGVVETEESVAARILASDEIPGEGREDAEADTVALRILRA